jgi:DNA-binding transcriptional ArsR family regulator
VIAAGNADVIANCKWQLSRLLRRLERSSRIDLALHGALRCIVSSLGAALLTAPNVDKPTRRKTLESRILGALLEGPKRPFSLADEFGMHQSLVSRALRKLRNKGLVTKIDTPWWEPDSRASWYELSFPDQVKGN